MTTLGLIGSGYIGGTVARLAVAAGHDVVLSNSRGPETLESLAAELGPQARAATGAEAAEAGDLVLVSIPIKACPVLPDGVTAALAGKVVLDTGNYYPERDGQIAELSSGSLTTAEWVAQLLPGAQVVKAFNNIFYKHLLNLTRPGDAPDRTYLPIAGDEEALAHATAFLSAIGYGAVGYGTLADSWRQEPGTPVYGAPYGSFEDEKGTPASEKVIRDALAAAKR